MRTPASLRGKFSFCRTGRSLEGGDSFIHRFAQNRQALADGIFGDGKELAQSEDEAHTFSFGKSKGYWASKKSVNYQNENTAVIMYAHPKDGELFVKGKYMIEVIAGGYPIGNTTLELE